MASDELHSPLARRRPMSMLIPTPDPERNQTSPGLKRLSLVAAHSGSPRSSMSASASGSGSGSGSSSRTTTPASTAGPSRSRLSLDEHVLEEDGGVVSRGERPTDSDRATNGQVRGHRERESVDSLGSMGSHASASSVGSFGLGLGGAGTRSLWSRTTPTAARSAADGVGELPVLSPSPRPRHAGRTSSISYSPSVSSYSAGLGSPLMTRSQRERATPSPRPVSGSGARAGEGDKEDKEGRRRSTDVLTLGEKHSDLLRMIAMRERRVNELKQELAVQEEALASLRARWTAIARSDAVVPTSTPARRRDAAAHTPTAATSVPPLVRSHPTAGAGANGSTSSTASSLPTVPDEEGSHDHARPGSPTASAAIGGLWSAITQDADETIQEGKRFWGQLLRTVGAAAGGTVPEEPGRMERVRSAGSDRGGGAGSVEEGKLDLPNLRTILPTFGFGLPTSTTPSKPKTPPPLERRTSRSSARDRSPIKAPASPGSPRSVRSLAKSPRLEMEGMEGNDGGDHDTPPARTLRAPNSASPPGQAVQPGLPERRLSVRLKRAALSPKPRLLTGEVEGAKDKDKDKEGEDGTGGPRSAASDSPRLVTATLDSVGW